MSNSGNLKKMAFCVYNSARWARLFNQRIYRHAVHIEQCYYNNSANSSTSKTPPFFPVTKHLFIQYCEPKFMEEYITKNNFPALASLFLRTHPGSYLLFRQWLRKSQIYVSDHYATFVEDWTTPEERRKYIHVIPDKELDEEFRLKR